MFGPKFRLWWHFWGLWLCIMAGAVVVIVFPIWYLSGMEESIRRYIIGINVASMPWGVLQTLIFVGFLYLLQYGGGMAAFSKTKFNVKDVQVRFSDVMGLKEAKEEAWEVVQLIKDRSLLKKTGGKIMRGMLLTGPPGCGKTLLAKAIAAEAKIPFMATAGSEFIEIFVGVGASRVRQLFRRARLYAAAHGGCIIFIDELEVLGRQRTFDAFGGSQEGNSTLNQLLVEMDGINEGDANVTVIGATNAQMRVLDPALLRPGRFDRKIKVGRPNLEEREQIFRYYGKKIKTDPELNFARLARKAVWKTPAEIENILKEAAVISIRAKREAVTMKDVSAAIERIELGVAHRLSMTDREREMTAYHEAGHLIMLFLEHPTRDVFKISILSRGDTLGVVHEVPKEEMYSQDRNDLYAHIKVSLGGYAAEKIRYDTTTTGVSSDFASATSLADAMVWNFGMTEGFLGDFDSMGGGSRRVSEGLKAKLNDETQKILRQALQDVEKTLRKEWKIVERFVNELLKRDELDYDEIVAIFAEYGKSSPIFDTRSLRSRTKDADPLPEIGEPPGEGPAPRDPPPPSA